MNEELSIGTDIACEPDVALTAATDAGESVSIDIKHLSADPENVAQFREQLHSKSQSKTTGSTSTAEGEAKHETSENSVLKRQLPNERNFFENNNRHTPPFVAGKSPYPSQSQSADGFRKNFYEKSMKFDISSQSSALKTAGGTPTSNVTHEEYVAYKSPFFEASDPSKASVNNTKDFRKTFTNTETLPTNTSLRNAAWKNKANFHAGVSHSDRDPSQPSPTLKSPATLLRELQNPTVSTGTRPSEASAVANTSIFAKTSEAVAKEPSSGISSAETLRTPENRTTLHSTTSSVSNFSPSPTDAFSKDGTVASSSSVRSSERNETVPVVTPHGLHTKTASETASASKTQTRERASENTSEPHRTAVIDTIPFLRTPNETVATVQEPTAAQQTQKSHATLIAQQIRNHIIDRILVSSSTLNDNHTVTVQLSPRLLQDTEIQFTQNGTSLDVRLVSQNKDSVQFLQQHQSDLQTYLQGELKTYRAISVRVPSSQASAELTQPQDGRSRNRFDYQPTDEEETS